MNNFDKAFTELLGNEGRYSDNPADPGGETMWGVTITTARAHGYTGSMQAMPVDTAKAIYRESYWRDEFDQVPYAISFQLFDTAVNSGPLEAVVLLQKALSVAADGRIGPATMTAVSNMDVDKLVMLFDAERLDFMADLKGWVSFGKGWAHRIANNLRKGATA